MKGGVAEQSLNLYYKHVTNLEKEILATLAYYDVLDFPMTVGEVRRFLINPQRFSRPAFHFKHESESWLAVAESLEQLRAEGIIEQRHGFYFLAGRGYLFQERMEKNKLAEEKWTKARRYLFWIQMLPFVEAVLASGSLALNHTTAESDLDILIIAKSGRIWTTRLLVYLLFGLRGVRRRKEQAVAPDKICPNHYITTRSLRLSFPSLYNAQTYAHLVPIYFKSARVLEDFWRENAWIGDFVGGWEKPAVYQDREVKRSVGLKTVRWIMEVVLGFGLDNLLEKIARALQKRRVRLNLPGRITLNDQQLEFHPYSVEGKILEQYNETIARTGFFGDYHETDSGLRE